MNINWINAKTGAIAGFIAAFVIDYQAFRTWKSFDDARRYNWSLALWRWVQGAIGGALAGGLAL